MEEGKRREGKGREGKGREGKGREGKGREGKGTGGRDREYGNRFILCGRECFPQSGAEMRDVSSLRYSRQRASASPPPEPDTAGPNHAPSIQDLRTVSGKNCQDIDSKVTPLDTVTRNKIPGLLLITEFVCGYSVETACGLQHSYRSGNRMKSTGTESVSHTPLAERKKLNLSLYIERESIVRITGSPRRMPTRRAVSTSAERCT